MAFSAYSGDTSIIADLGTNVQDRGLTTEQFKAAFDQFGTEFVAWFNATHKGELEGHTHLPAQVGLGNVVNESKETLFTSPVLTGTPTAPTQVVTDDSTKLATTAFVQAGLDTISPLYMKIRNIADTSGSISCSVDVSDIDWNTYREIRLIGEVSSNVSGDVCVRVNGATSGYSGCLINTAQTSLLAFTTELGGITVTASSAQYGYFDISFLMINETPRSIVAKTHETIDANNGKAMSGIVRLASVSAFSTINFVKSNGSGTVYLRNLRLWGVKKLS